MIIKIGQNFATLFHAFNAVVMLRGPGRTVRSAAEMQKAHFAKTRTQTKSSCLDAGTASLTVWGQAFRAAVDVEGDVPSPMAPLGGVPDQGLARWQWWQ
jgi:hypothetical protein